MLVSLHFYFGTESFLTGLVMLHLLSQLSTAGEKHVESCSITDKDIFYMNKTVFY